jgi:hypothetical protein
MIYSILELPMVVQFYTSVCQMLYALTNSYVPECLVSFDNDYLNTFPHNPYTNNLVLRLDNEMVLLLFMHITFHLLAFLSNLIQNCSKKMIPGICSLKK